MAAFAPKDPALAKKYFEEKLSFSTGPVELSKALEKGAVRVVDVRAAEDFAREHIPGSVSLPEAEWANASARGLAKDQTNVVVCYSQVCHLAARAAVQLASQGFPVMELEGGFKAWKEHDLPVERGDATKPDDAVGRARALLAETRAEATKATGEAKPTEAKPAEEKPAEAKPAEAKPTEAKADDAKADDAKPAEPKPDEAKPDEAKPTDAKAADAKPTEAKGDDAKQPDHAKSDAKPNAKADASADADGASSDDDAEPDDADDASPARRTRPAAQRPAAR